MFWACKGIVIKTKLRTKIEADRSLRTAAAYQPGFFQLSQNIVVDSVKIWFFIENDIKSIALTDTGSVWKIMIEAYWWGLLIFQNTKQ